MKKSISLLTIVVVLLTSGCSAIKPTTPQGESGVDGTHVTAFVHVNLVPMTEEVVLEDHTVIVDGARIVTVGPAEEVPMA